MTKPGLPLLDAIAAAIARDQGMAVAVDHADTVEPDWQDQAFKFLLAFGPTVEEFQGEDVRVAAEDHVPQPPDNRAWGPIINRAARAGLIRRVDIRPQKSVSCHCSPKSVWSWIRR